VPVVLGRHLIEDFAVAALQCSVRHAHKVGDAADGALLSEPKPRWGLGDPDPAKISTSYVERQKPHDADGMRQFTLLTNGFSKKIENHIAAVGVHFMHTTSLGLTRASPTHTRRLRR
jgi:hypothetical protein